MPTVRAIARDAARQNYRFSSIVLGIVQERAVPDEDARRGPTARWPRPSIGTVDR